MVSYLLDWTRSQDFFKIASLRKLKKRKKKNRTTEGNLSKLHYLPNKFNIDYTVLLVAFKALNGLPPAYLTNVLKQYNP